MRQQSDTTHLAERALMKRVAFGELYRRLRNSATDQLTKNPAAERSWGSFVSASIRKGLRAVYRWARSARERLGMPRERLSGGRRWRLAENSRTLAPKYPIQLTSLLVDNPEGNRFIKQSGERPTATAGTSSRVPAGG